MGDAGFLTGVALLAVLSAIFVLSGLQPSHAGAEPGGFLVADAGVDVGKPGAASLRGCHLAAHSDCAALVPPVGSPLPAGKQHAIAIRLQTGLESAVGPPLLHPPKPL